MSCNFTSLTIYSLTLLKFSGLTLFEPSMMKIISSGCSKQSISSSKKSKKNLDYLASKEVSQFTIYKNLVYM